MNSSSTPIVRSATTVIVLIATMALLNAGCSKSAPDAPVIGLGNNAVTKYVSVGNSLTAGYQSNALYASAQMYSYPNLIAKQLQMAGSTISNFEQPLYGDPGTPDAVTGKAARYELISLIGPVIGPRGFAPGSPANTALTRPYDNVGIPGAVIFDFLDTTSFAIKALPPRSNPMFGLVLRSSAFGRSVFAQVRALSPDLVTFWLGNNDVLGYATSGGVSPSTPTSSAVFSVLYQQALDSLRAALPNTKIVVANIPDVTAIPFFTTIGPKVAAVLPAGVYLRYQKHGNSSVAFDSTRLTEANAPLLTLVGSTYASLIGQPGGKWYRDKNYPALPAGIDTTKPFGVHPQNPWPNALTLDFDEQAIAGAAVRDFNATILAVANAKGAAVADMNSFFNTVKANGLYTCGIKFTAAYVSGGLFSLDGVHPSSQGQGVVANQFIKMMNAKWGMNLSFVDVSAIPAIPGPLAKSANEGMPVIPVDAFRDLRWLWGKEE